MPFAIDFSKQTGGNRGIGLALSRAIAGAGGNLAILYRSSLNATEVGAELAKEFGVTVKVYQCDVSDQNRVREVFDQADAEFEGGIHGVVANAGVAIVKDALEVGQEEFDFMCELSPPLGVKVRVTLVATADIESTFETAVKTNVLGVFYTAQAAAKLWVKREYKQGSIVVISSMSSQIYNTVGQNQPLKHVFYNSSKAAVSSMTKALATEWAPYGIRTNLVSPGYVATEQSGVHSEEARAWMSGGVPLGRTGSEVFVDGGFLVY